jgi:hypothetical protein
MMVHIIQFAALSWWFTLYRLLHCHDGSHYTVCCTVMMVHIIQFAAMSWWFTLYSLLHCHDGLHYTVCCTVMMVHIIQFAAVSWWFTLCSLLHCPITAIFPGNPFSNALSPFSSRIVRDQVSHPCKPYAELQFCNYDTVSLADFAPKATVTMLNQ